MDPALGTRDIWMFDVKRGIAERFTSDPSDEFAPVWAPDGGRLIFSSHREGRVDLFQKAQATTPEERIPDEGLPLGKFAADWSPDGESVLFIAGGRTIARSDIMALPSRGGAARTSSTRHWWKRRPASRPMAAGSRTRRTFPAASRCT